MKSSFFEYWTVTLGLVAALGWLHPAWAQDSFASSRLLCTSQPVRVEAEIENKTHAKLDGEVQRWDFGHQFVLLLEKTQADRFISLEVWADTTKLFTLLSGELQSFQARLSRVEIPFIVGTEAAGKTLPYLEKDSYLLPLQQGYATELTLIVRTSRDNRPGCILLSKKITMGEIQQYAIITGFNYAGTLHQLKYAISDAEAIARHFVSRLKMKPQNIWLMTDDIEGSKLRVPAGINVTKAEGPDAFQNTMNLIFERADYQSQLYIYYSGHILVEPPIAFKPTPRLVFPNSKQGLASTYLSRADLLRLTQDMSISSLVLIMDACFSGSADARYADGSSGKISHSKSFRPPSIGHPPDDPEPNGARLMSSNAVEPSWEFDELKHGVFTYFLLQSSREGESLKLSDAFDDAVSKMSNFTPQGWKTKLVQTPKRAFGGAGRSVLWSTSN